MKTMRRYLMEQFGRERGSALLVSLMVMVGLSLLGLGFVAITETESAIATNERNSAQALAAAETGAKVVVEWFQDTAWCRDHGLLPANVSAFKTTRKFTDASLNGYYKSNATDMLFDKPFKGANSNRFSGEGEDAAVDPPTADVWIYIDKNVRSTAFLNDATTGLNTLLFVPDAVHNESVRISDIRVYAPPMPGATRNADGFWEGGSARYGLATIRVTAQKLSGNRVVAERVVKTVLSETPFPTVDGAIETSGTLVGQGSFEVYWGKVLSEKGIELKRAVPGMPWFDAKNMMNFEYGFDSARPRENSKAYAVGDVVMAPLVSQNNVAELTKFSYKATAAGTTGAAIPADGDWPTAIGDSFNTDGGVIWQADYRVSFPIDNDFYRSTEWLYQLQARTIDDPWLHARARQEIEVSTGAPCGQATAPHPCDYTAASDDVTALFSNMFQFQTTTDPSDRPERVEAVFPTMDYEFWKNVAQSGNNENGVYYFKYTDGATGTSQDFTGPGGQVQTIYKWLNSATDTTTNRPMNGLGAGFYFFDTKNSKNPQFGKGGILTPQIKINSGSVDSPFQMQGYIYLSAEFFGTTGAGNLTPTDLYPMPGEPFRDVGYVQAKEGLGPTYPFDITGTLPTGDYIWIGRTNGQWDFQDINGNAKFDLFLAKKTVTRPDGSTATDIWLPVPFYNDCQPGDNVTAGANCSEPHEPYLNMTYIPDNFGAANPTTGVTAEWYDPGVSGATVATYRKPKRRTGLNTTVTCTATSLSDCTSNGYDVDGALTHIDALLWGALYNEGGYDGSGNAVYYGALLMRASFQATGTPTVYFNECLARGCLEDQLRLQRVTMTSWQTD